MVYSFPALTKLKNTLKNFKNLAHHDLKCRTSLKWRRGCGGEMEEEWRTTVHSENYGSRQIQIYLMLNPSKKAG